jgi:membrane-associated phospholipid phosphatase
MADEYALPGDPPFFQVEPESSYWLRCPVLRNVELHEIREELDAYFEKNPYPLSDSDTAQGELDEIQFRFDNRENADEFPQEQLSVFLRDPIYVERGVPAGAVLNRRDNGRPGHSPIILNGGELARLFEAETPGLWHRHAFNVILDLPVEGDDGPRLRELLSPTRQALIWMALDTAIFSALSAVWHYKWIATDLEQVARRQRPWEAPYKNSKGGKVSVLFDNFPAFDGAGNIVLGDPKAMPQPTPGSPRHPAYGSGHSSYSAAASFVLGCLLPTRYVEDFRKLAENIGEARIWGGVHWRSDHDAGREIGLVVGRRVIEQLNRSGIKAQPSQRIDPQKEASREQLEAEGQEFEKNCGKGTEDFCAAEITPERFGFQGTQG